LLSYPFWNASSWGSASAPLRPLTSRSSAAGVSVMRAFSGFALRVVVLVAAWDLCSAQNAFFSTVQTLAGREYGFADGIGEGASMRPYGVAIDVSGTAFFSAENSAIRKVTLEGVVTTLAGSGTPGNIDGTGTGASFSSPMSVAADVGNNVFVPDDNRIRKVTPFGVVTTLAGSGSYAFANGIGTDASFCNPLGVAVDSSGNVIVADTNNNRIRKVTPGGVVSTIAGNGSAEFADGTGTGASFKGPSGVAVDASGNVVVADGANNRIRIVTPGGVVTTLAGDGFGASSYRGRWVDGTGVGASFFGPRGIAFDARGNVIVADVFNDRIRRVTPGGAVTTLAGNGQRSFSDGDGNIASFNFPSGVAVVADGRIIVADSGNNRIRIVSLTPCPTGYYCPDYSKIYPCGNGTYCPGGSSSPTPCPADAPGLLVSAGSLAACYLQGGGGSAAPTAAPGAACFSNSYCPSSACRGGYCCSATAKTLGCAVCTPPFGACLLNSPGEACATNADCGTNLCAGGCCCSSSAVQAVGCASCRCLAWPSTTAANAGSCNVTATTTLSNATLPCNASTSLTASVALSRVISFPAAANVTGAAPLVFLPAASPLNAIGVDIVVASPAACAAFAAAFSASQCSALTYALSTGTYYYLGTAAALGMTATPSCAT
jgi:hypothetical protein